MSVQQYSLENSCICKDEKILVSFETEKRIHKRWLCENCIKLIKSFQTVKIISEVSLN